MLALRSLNLRSISYILIQHTASVSSSQYTHEDLRYPPCNPYDLLSTWHAEACELDKAHANVLSLATSNRNYEIGNRNMLLRRITKDGFVFATYRRCRKSKDLVEVPKAAGTLLWRYKKDDVEITTQVRAEGDVSELSSAEQHQLFEELPLFLKIDAYDKVKKEELNKKYGNMLSGEVQIDPKDLEMPDDYVGYILTPKIFHFYVSSGIEVGKQVTYRLKNDVWENNRSQ